MIKFELPGAPPLLLNARLHWTKRRKLSKEWKDAVWYASRSQRPEEPYERAIVRYVRYCGTREPDFDNLASGFKWIQDGLVDAGILQDDSMANIEAYYEWKPATKREKRVLIEVVPILDRPA